jgi:hypothetical protein
MPRRRFLTCRPATFSGRGGASPIVFRLAAKSCALRGRPAGSATVLHRVVGAGGEQEKTRQVIFYRHQLFLCPAQLSDHINIYNDDCNIIFTILISC